MLRAKNRVLRCLAAAVAQNGCFDPNIAPAQQHNSSLMPRYQVPGIGYWYRCTGVDYLYCTSTRYDTPGYVQQYHFVRSSTSQFQFFFAELFTDNVPHVGQVIHDIFCLVVPGTGWFKHKTSNSFRVQCPRRFWVITPEMLHSCFMCPCRGLLRMAFFFLSFSPNMCF